MNLDKDLTEINRQIAEQSHVFPRHLNIVDQGMFHIGYYFQKQNYFTKKDSAETQSYKGE